VYTKGFGGATTDTSTAAKTAEAKATFNIVFQSSTYGIVRRECPSCADTHKDAYVKRLASPSTFDAFEALLVTWSSDGNAMGADFTIHSTLEDALAGSNAWAFCNFNDAGIGFPRDCGPTGPSGGQWNSLKRGGQPTIRFSVYTAA